MLLTIETANAQSLIEKLGGIRTDFEIRSISTDVPVLSQAIVKRGMHRSRYHNGLDEAYGYAYGVQTYYLEFSTNSKLHERYVSKKGRWTYYEVKLYDNSGKLIMEKKIDNHMVAISSNGDDLRTYSLNLKEIPLILLDQTKKITIEKVRTYKK
jgi:hypothetical protein